jgi:putative ABC transport system permease protein
MNGALIIGTFKPDGGLPVPRRFLVDKPVVSPDYFRVMGMPLLSGRAFGSQDHSKAPGVAIVSRSVARAFWTDGHAVGKRITLEDHPSPADWLTIVGEVDDVRQDGLTQQAHPAVYRPYTQVRFPFFLSHMNFVVRTAGPPAALTSAVRGVLRQVDRDQAAQSITTMADLVATTTAEPQFQARLITAFSALALLLAAIGIYSVLACAVAERTREIGIRMALGAERSDITRMVLKRSLLLAALGLSLGVGGAAVATRVLARFLFEVTPTDIPTFVVVAAILGAVAILSGLLPAHRATRVDPLIALKWE